MQGVNYILIFHEQYVTIAEKIKKVRIIYNGCRLKLVIIHKEYLRCTLNTKL